ncbi:MAG: hypothetical protein VX034_08500, partial [Planctomycetota bacterium]|nr:hypothetical protein [Planctomycetota bacterium]
MTNHGPHAQSAPPVRRRFMGEMVQGLGGIALASLLGSDGLLASDDEIQNGASDKTPIRPPIDPRQPFASRDPHFAAKAKNVIVIFCSGACS